VVASARDWTHQTNRQSYWPNCDGLYLLPLLGRGVRDYFSNAPTDGYVLIRERTLAEKGLEDAVVFPPWRFSRGTSLAAKQAYITNSRMARVSGSGTREGKETLWFTH